MFDTSFETGQVVESSPRALTGKNRLRKGSWIAPADAVPLVAVFVNLTSYFSLRSGSLLATPPVDQPTGWTLSHGKGQTVSNGALVGIPPVLPPTGRGQAFSVVRIFASATTHVSQDIAGASVLHSEVTRTTPAAQAERLQKAVAGVHR